ncbi:MAG: OsmC family peroxiredoxin [Acidobacteria bacterium]|nr:OsmC family peroxiredoxin [Acidobacteriota bacterium]
MPHHYAITTRWTGNLGTGTSSYRAYSRDFELAAAAKYAPVLATSDPAFRGDPTRYNTEELLVGCLAGCHMLWMLHLCADARIVVESYEDHSTGTMEMSPDGGGQFTEVTLHPRLTLADPSRQNELAALHHRAHALCFIARSMNFPVHCEPVLPADSGQP